MITTPDSSIKFRLPALRPTPARRGPDVAPDATEERERLLPPRQRGFQVIPKPDVLEKLLARALEALREGIFWDRGSILNILV